jgi:uncharacterized protein GlcG (DUF336 family)
MGEDAPAADATWITRTGPSRRLAERLVAAMIAESDRLAVAMALAVCDAGGHLVLLTRMDGAPLLAVQTAPAKARTAVFLRRPTAATVELAKRNPEVYGSFLSAASDRLVLSMGGEPLWDGPDLIGAVAAAGGSGAQDVAVAQAALAVWSEIAPEGAPAQHTDWSQGVGNP